VAETRRTIDSLVGEELSAVSFVMDYVEFHFNGPVFRALTHPVLSDRNLEIRFPSLGSRDALCGLIGQTVSKVIVLKGEAITLQFERGASLRVPLDKASRMGPEAAHFMGALVHAPLDVW
jgi:hypothetical protein